jgi:hypothetical protein
VCLLQGCAKNESAPAEDRDPLPVVTTASIEKAVSAYEEIRRALAQDRSNVRSQALALAGAAQVAATTAPESLQTPLDDLSTASQRLGILATDDLAEARAAFGEISRAMVSLLSQAPSVRRGMHVYECPMAQGYKKWVQSDDAISNPYMGSDMPKCGTEARF